MKQNCFFKKIFLIICLSFLISGCDPLGSKTIIDYPDSVWETGSEDLIYVKITSTENCKLTSVVKVNNIEFDYTNRFVSQALYFEDTFNSENTFKVWHYWVKDDSSLECQATTLELSKIFNFEITKNETFKFTLYKQ